MQVAIYMQGDVPRWAHNFWAGAQRHGSQDEAFALLRSEALSVAQVLVSKHPRWLDALLTSTGPEERNPELLTLPAALWPVACIQGSVNRPSRAVQIDITSAPDCARIVLDVLEFASHQRAHPTAHQLPPRLHALAVATLGE